MPYETLVLYAARAFETAGIAAMLPGTITPAARYIHYRSHHEFAPAHRAFDPAWAALGSQRHDTSQADTLNCEDCPATHRADLG